MQLKRRLAYTRGYLELGMIPEAVAELAAVPPGEASSPEVQGLHACVLQEQKNWPALRTLSELMARNMPEEVSWWITWAYATRRAASLAAAEQILLEAECLHPEEGIIQFNLGCYACQRGELPLARARIERAITLDGHFRESAATDPDLAPLRETEAAP